MKVWVISHCAGDQKVPKSLQEEIVDAVRSVELQIRKGSAAAVREKIMEQLISKGWSTKVSVSQHSAMTITSVKRQVGLCLQTGNMARMYADLLKLQKLYSERFITSGVIIVPSRQSAKVMGDNLAHSARLERELEIFNTVIHIPLLLIAME